MAGHEAWWLQKNSLIAAHALANSVDPFKDRGRFDPDMMLPHIAASAPAMPSDQAKQEVFGGGRRPRRYSYEETVCDVPYGTVAPSPRRHSHDEVSWDQHTMNQLLELPSWNGAPRIPPASCGDWRIGDDKPFALDGLVRPRQERKEPQTEWRLGDDLPLTLTGAEPGPRYTPRVTFDSDWRKPAKHMTDELQPDNNMSPMSRQRILASRHVSSTFSPRLDTKWRKGSRAPLQLVNDSSSGDVDLDSPRQTPTSNSNWRLGDPRPFRMDGSAVERSTVTGLKAASDWRKGDAKPLSWSGGGSEESSMPVTPRMSFADQKELLQARERRICQERDELEERLARIGRHSDADLHPSEGRSVVRLRRGENNFGPSAGLR